MTTALESSPAAPLVDIAGLRVTFMTESGLVDAVKGVNLSVQPGEVLAIVGESGSGKSVTARSIVGLLPDNAVSSGSITLIRKGTGNPDQMVGATEDDYRAVRGAEVSMVFQEPSTALNPVYTVGDQIAEALKVHGVAKGKAAEQRVVDIMRAVGIPEPEKRYHYYPHQFSGGQRQRVVIAIALVLNPRLILADEPTTALDVTVQAEILDLLRKSKTEFGASIVIITHNMGVVADIADRVVVMNQGEVVEHGDVHDVFASPRHPYTKQLLAAVPTIGQHAPRELTRPDAPVVVEARDLVVEYPGGFRRPGFRAVDSVSFDIREGEVLGLVGESGSGKTSTGRAIAGLNLVTDGSLVVLGRQMKGMSEKEFRASREEIGFVFQDPATSFDPRMRIGDILAEAFLIHGQGGALEKKTRELLELVHLPAAFAERFPHELSGGQRQRVGIGRALALRPKLLIADEPTSALDVSVQAKVLDLFKELQAEMGFACLFITHDLAVVDHLAHRVAVMRNGKIVEQGPTRTVLSSPAEEYTQRLLAALPIPDPIRQRARRAG